MPSSVREVAFMNMISTTMSGRAAARPLTHDEKPWAFRRATNGFANAGERWKERARTGLSDDQLEEALRYELGIMGGSGGPGQPSLAYQSAGLKIWASWDGINMVQDKPILAGRATLNMAREIYGIRDPSDRQTSLF